MAHRKGQGSTKNGRDSNPNIVVLRHMMETSLALEAS